MGEMVLPESYNYIAVFLTLNCNYYCSYCITEYGSRKTKGTYLSGQEWVQGLNRIRPRDDLPITLQGGEPSLHKDFIYIINNLRPELKIDILTNLQFDVRRFIAQVNPVRLKRRSPYASIRVSFHPEVMDLEETIKKVLALQAAGFSVGLWGILHPAYTETILKAQTKSQSIGIDFRAKEFLGEYQGRLSGTYLYQDACSKRFKRSVLCKTTELIIGPSGDIYRCHSDLYENRKPIGKIVDPEFKIIDSYRPCAVFGHCNPCDVKIKTNRLQKYGHTSVQIKEA